MMVVVMWIIGILMELFIPICCYKCDFEDNSCLWSTTGSKGFLIEKAQDGRQRGFPSTDITEGTEEGHYAIAIGDTVYSQQGATEFMISPCFGASGPNCSLDFSAVINGKSQQESIGIYIQKNCSSSHSLSNIRSIKNHTDGWENHTILISNLTDPFKVVLIAHVPYGESYIALDDLFMSNCEKDALLKSGCLKDEFRCQSSLCISKDRICNLHHDCLDGEDESLTVCEKLPDFARVTFEECNFVGGGCWWHNLPSTNVQWELASGEAPSMMGPKHDHTTSLYDKSGNYVYMRTSNQKAGEQAILESTLFDPPYFNDGSCKVRFHYHMYGKHVFRLQLEVRQVCDPDIRTMKLIWSRTRRVKRNEWIFEAVPLVNITEKFVLRFTGFVGYLTSKGDIALDDITLSPECFKPDTVNITNTKVVDPLCHKVINMATCGAKGPNGPTQMHCDMSYDGKIRVIESGRYAGVQVWTVPETNVYSILALGAQGGRGARNMDEPQRGDYVHAKMKLMKGELLHVLVGQQGGSACDGISERDDVLLQEVCLRKSSNASTQVFNRSVTGGGGGGGGATVIFKIDKVTHLPIILMVAGGGGGLSFLRPAAKTFDNTGLKRIVGKPYPGVGGSVFYPTNAPVGGGALLDGAVGGISCNGELPWRTYGGFGGGGGPCQAGGGAGGYEGGNASISDSPYHAGMNGSSYVIRSSTQVKIETNIRAGSGEVDIYLPINCSCEIYCIWVNVTLNSFYCLCPNNSTLDEDGLTCIGPDVLRQRSLSLKEGNSLIVGHWLGIIIPCIILITIIPLVYLVYRRRLVKSSKNIIKLDRMITSRQNGNIVASVMQINTNYDIVMSNCPDNQLRELPRRHLKLARLLGHGAFGEVYQGFLASVAHLTEDLKVAVKTLPALCTEQTEIDFITEAVILRSDLCYCLIQEQHKETFNDILIRKAKVYDKFNHPNIVKLIGVCFDKTPRYIVLELLEGGDLKMFLRESRPTPTRSPGLKILDLLRLCHDVACACQHLEEKHFIHRDIAARNCLLTTKGSSRRAKIADFGMSRDIYRSDYYKKTGKALLPVKWMPPEAFLDGIFTSKTDIWSYGILLWEIFSLGHMPYPGCTNEEVMQTVTMGGRLSSPEGCPISIYHIMSECWTTAPEDRPSFSTIVNKIEKSLEDDEIASRELTAFYQPNFTGANMLRLPSGLMLTNVRALECLPESSNYLEPLLPTSPQSPSDTFSSCERDNSRSPLLGKTENQVPCSTDEDSNGSMPVCDEPYHDGS